MPELSTGLMLLLSHGKLAEAAEQIQSSPALYRECEAAYPAIERAMRDATAPAGDAIVARIIGKRLAIYPQPDRSEDEWVAWWDAYYDTLSDLPEKCLEGAMRDWVRSPAQFLPKPGELRALAQKHGQPEYVAYATSRRALSRPLMTFSPEEVEARRAQVAEAIATVFKKPGGAA